MYTVYILLCADDSLYIGVAKDVEKRFAQHQLGVGARYTRAHGVKKIVYIEKKRTRSSALKREYALKQFSREAKLQLIHSKKEAAAWVWRTRIVRRYVRKSIAGTAQEYAEHRESAQQYIQERLKELNQAYGFFYKRVVVKNQKTRWGSCSHKGNLNIHYKVATLPRELGDYVLVHELCHLKELNHSKKFWTLVKRTIPNYLELRARLHAS
ncbi:MAG: DUF45 domain-containing protein [Candidatus Kerfeldbacteria bacterium]|nr:DUF45 domain-containing protein [Candidatus Kerfeldbacteria bacterium]